MEFTEKPILPSFHTLMSEIEDTSKMVSHRRHKSDHLSAFKPFEKDEPITSILPVFEKLSIQSIPVKQSINKDSVYYPMPTYHQKVHRSLHSRSYSDHSHPYPSNGPPHTTGPQLTTIHRRTVSATNLDFILQPNEPYNPSSLVASSSLTTSISHASPKMPEESTILSESPVLGLKSENKYHCSYCNKKFSRPSSLRIHIYSHTGERPFECPNPLCSRKFSVQSNLRRHMRIHRTGKVPKFANDSNSSSSSSNSEITGATGTSYIGAAGQVNRAQLAQKPLAAKPISWFN